MADNKVEVLHFTHTKSGTCFHFCRKCFLALCSPKHNGHELFMGIVRKCSRGTMTCDGLRSGHCDECAMMDILALTTELPKFINPSINPKLN